LSNFGSASFGTTSTGNSSTAALSSAATFTGTWEQNDYPEVMVSCQTDNSGTLYFDFSVDGTNATTFPVSGFAVASGIHEFHVAVKGPRYFRARLVNDSGAQSYLRLSTYYGQNFTRPNAPLNQSVGRDTDATVVRTIDPQDEISIGQRSGIAQFNKFAYRDDLDTADGSALIIADDVTNNITLLTTAETFTIAYDGTAGGSTDGASTTGARNLYFYYIGSDGKETISVHTLETDGSDVTSFSGFGLNRVAVGSSGTNQANGSDITITHTTTGTVAGFIPAGESTTQQAMFFTPTNARAVAKSIYVNIAKLSGGGSPRITIKGWVWNRPIATKYLVYRHVMDTAVDNFFSFTDACNFPLNPGDVLWFEAETDTNNTVIGGFRFSVNLYENT